jgi:folylpolyglutamate synthase/dihydropteroate synthase
VASKFPDIWLEDAPQQEAAWLGSNPPGRFEQRIFLVPAPMGTSAPRLVHFVLDVAHNAAALEKLMAHVAENYPPEVAGSVRVVAGFSSGKDVTANARAAVSRGDALFCGVRLHSRTQESAWCNVLG